MILSDFLTVVLGIGLPTQGSFFTHNLQTLLTAKLFADTFLLIYVLHNAALLPGPS